MKDILDLETANAELLARVVKHRSLVLGLKKMKNIDIYDKQSKCRFCGKVVKTRKLEDHAHPCLYVVSHFIPKNNRDLKRFTHRRIHIVLSRVKGKPSWMERVVLWLIDLLETFDHERTVNSFIAYLELNGFIVYRWEGRKKRK